MMPQLLLLLLLLHRLLLIVCPSNKRAGSSSGKSVVHHHQQGQCDNKNVFCNNPQDTMGLKFQAKAMLGLPTNEVVGSNSATLF